MKIAIYAHAFAPLIGGAEAYVMLLAQGLLAQQEKRGNRLCEVVVLTATPAGHFDDAALPFHVVRQPGLLTLWRQIGEADLVHLAGPAFLPLIFGLLRGRPVVVEHHGYPPVCPNGLLFYEPSQTTCPGHFMAQRYLHCLRCNARTAGLLKSFLMLLGTFPRRWMCRRVAFNLPITQHVQERLQLPRSKVIYYGIDDSLVSRSAGTEAVVSLGSIEAPIVFAYVGRLVKVKGLSSLVEAAKRLKDAGCSFRLKFVGDGPERAKLEGLANKLGVANRVQFTGYLTGAPMHAAMADVAVVVMPSLWEETAGLAAIEQMMRGRLVIAADIGGLGEVVDGAGLRFPPGDVEALAACMRRVLEHPELIRQIGETARHRALALFQRKRMVQQHWQVYKRLGATNFGDKA